MLLLFFLVSTNAIFEQPACKLAGFAGVKRHGFVVHNWVRPGGFGNKLDRLWNAMELAFVLNRTLLVTTAGDSTADYLKVGFSHRDKHRTSGGFVQWHAKVPDDAKSCGMTFDDLMPRCRTTGAACVAELAGKSCDYVTLLGGEGSYFPTWRQDVSNSAFFAQLPCVAAHVMQPAESIDAQVTALLNASHTVAVHVRSNDRDMMNRMTGNDDAAALITRSFFGGRRRLNLAMGGISGDLPRAGCDGAGLGSMLVSLEHLLGCLDQLRRPGTVVFEASDSTRTDGWFRERVPGLVQSEGVPVHSGREIDAKNKGDAAKVVVDYFVLSRTTAFITNCPGESTFVANVELLRDALQLPTYRGLAAATTAACTQLAPYPSHVHDLDGVFRQADNIVFLPIAAAVIAAAALAAGCVVGRKVGWGACKQRYAAVRYV